MARSYNHHQPGLHDRWSLRHRSVCCNGRWCGQRASNMDGERYYGWKFDAGDDLAEWFVQGSSHCSILVTSDRCDGLKPVGRSLRQRGIGRPADHGRQTKSDSTGELLDHRKRIWLPAGRDSFQWRRPDDHYLCELDDPCGSRLPGDFRHGSRTGEESRRQPRQPVPRQFWHRQFVYLTHGRDRSSGRHKAVCSDRCNFMDRYLGLHHRRRPLYGTDEDANVSHRYCDRYGSVRPIQRSGNAYSRNILQRVPVVRNFGPGSNTAVFLLSAGRLAG